MREHRVPDSAADAVRPRGCGVDTVWRLNEITSVSHLLSLLTSPEHGCGLPSTGVTHKAKLSTRINGDSGALRPARQISTLVSLQRRRCVNLLDPLRSTTYVMILHPRRDCLSGRAYGAEALLSSIPHSGTLKASPMETDCMGQRSVTTGPRCDQHSTSIHRSLPLNHC